MPDQGLLARIKRGLSRDKDLSVVGWVRKGARLLRETANARLQLSRCTRIGATARLAGRVLVDNRGSIVIGDGLAATATFLPIELITSEGGHIDIGNDAWINFGVVIASAQSVRIGNGVMIGQHCIISDVDIPERVRAGAAAEARPIDIGDNVWLAGRVTVMPGVRIGEGSVITAGSIVTSDVPPHVVAGGIPTRVLRSLNGAGEPTAQDTVVLADPPPDSVTRSVERRSGVIVSDFTIDELAEELALDNGQRGVVAHVRPFGQVAQALLEEPEPGSTDFVVVWTRPDATAPSFGRALAFEEVDERQLLAEVDDFCGLIERAAAAYRFVFVPTWVNAWWVRGRGMSDGRKGGTMRYLGAMNERLLQRFENSPNVFVLDATRWFLAGGRATTAQRGWYIGKVAVPRAVLAEAALDIKAAIESVTGGARKLLVLDLDDTLWGGIVGDVGWEGLRLGGHDSVGEAFVDFQRAVKHLKSRGVILALASKNEESVALDAIRNHPEMVLREEDFVGWKINWSDKAKNIAELTSALNLGLQSVVFIDDNPVERARVREALPEVLVPEWPEDTLLYPSALQMLRCFDTAALSQEDRDRTRLYAEERQRERLQQDVGSVEDWLKGLDIRVSAEPLGPVNLKRSVQLLNKTNQMNLSTRRLSERELLDWASSPDRQFLTVSVADRFGDAGLTGLVSVERDGADARIVDYVLSCRVMGRKVEETMMHLAVSAAREWHCTRVIADYAPTAKNKPCLTFLQASGFSGLDERRFIWDTAQPYDLPAPVTLAWQR